LMLLTHTVLAATVPFMAMRTIWLGLKDRRASHRKWARWTFPIWLYVFTDSSRLAFERLGT